MLNEGVIEDDPTLKFKYYDESHVAFLSSREKKIQLLNVVDGTYNQKLDHATLPTKLALEDPDNADHADKLANL
jgi:hypothetical protein